MPKKPNVFKYDKEGNITHRRCSNCGKFKTVRNYHRNSGSPSNLTNVCKTCMKDLIKSDASLLNKNDIADWMNSPRFTDRVEVEDRGYDTPCHIWTGAGNPSDYGQVMLKYVKSRPHVLVLMNKLGRPLAKGKETSHLCHTRRCVNPDHLVEETHAENMARRFERERAA